MADLARVDTIANMWRFLCVIWILLAGNDVAGGPILPVTVAPSLSVDANAKPAPGMFLVAKRALDDPNFGQSVVYLAEHDANGTLGLIVNRSSKYSLADAVPEVENDQASQHVLNFGGPVGMSMIFMLIRSDTAAKGMANVAGDVYISADRSVLDAALADAKPATELRFYLGHSGWAPGQLEFELQQGSWHVVAANHDAIFAEDSGLLWQRLIERLEPQGIQVENQGGGTVVALASGVD